MELAWGFPDRADPVLNDIYCQHLLHALRCEVKALIRCATDRHGVVLAQLARNVVQLEPLYTHGQPLYACPRRLQTRCRSRTCSQHIFKRIIRHQCFHRRQLCLRRSNFMAREHLALILSMSDQNPGQFTACLALMPIARTP